MDFLFGKAIQRLSGMLDYRAKRHQLIVSNVVNIDTAGFRPSDISFEKELGQAAPIAMATTDGRHIPKTGAKGGAVAYELRTSDEKANIDNEMSNLAENHLMYNMTVEMLARKFKGINTVLKEAK